MSASRKPQAASRKPQAASGKPQAASRKPQAASRKRQAAFLVLVLSLSAVFPASPVLAADWYAAPWGTPTGDGTWNNPWDLQTALDPKLQPSPPGPVQAGDTVWLRGGDYVPQQACAGGLANYCCELAGTPTQPIVVRGWASDPQPPRIDGGVRQGNSTIFFIDFDVNRENGYVHFRDFEIMSSATDHHSECVGCSANCQYLPCSSLPDDIEPAMAFIVDTSGTVPGLKFIDLVIHDTATPFNLFGSAEGAEVYGGIFYYNGWHTKCLNGCRERGHGHGIYMRNPTTTPKKAIDNIVFSQFGSGIHCYDSTPGSLLNNLHVEGNIVFNNGVLTALFDPPYDYGYQDNILIGDSADVVDPQVLNNYTYFTPAGFEGGRAGGRNRLGYEGTSLNAVVRGSYFVTQTGLALQFAGTNATIENNLFYGSTLDPNGIETLQFWREHPELGNLFYNPPPGAPSGIATFVRPNLYEAGRGHVVVYNWADVNDVAVDVSDILMYGDFYDVRDAQNYYGPPVTSGRYMGGTISIPMGDVNAPVSIPWGTPDREPPKHTPRQFGAFVVIRTFMQQEGPIGGGP